MKACRPWLLGEIARVQPKVIVTLGNSAAQAVIRPDFRILRERGRVTGGNAVNFAGTIIATVHPMFILRLPDVRARQQAFQQLVRELTEAARLVRTQ